MNNTILTCPWRTFPLSQHPAPYRSPSSSVLPAALHDPHPLPSVHQQARLEVVIQGYSLNYTDMFLMIVSDKWAALG